MYTIDFESLQSSNRIEKRIHLDKSFFSMYDEFVINDGDVDIDVVVDKISFGHFSVSFDIYGDVVLPCDRCLEDMEEYIETEGIFKVRYGMDIQLGNEIISTTEDSDGEYDYTLPDGVTTLDMSWAIYELIELAIPLQHIHPDGECNPDMEDLLQQHIAMLPGGEDEVAEDPEEEDTTDPRWDALKKILNNN